MKRKITLLIASSVLVSSIATTLPNNLKSDFSSTAHAAQSYPTPGGSSAKPYQPHYKKAGTTTKVVTVGQQKQNEAIKQLGITAASTVAGYGGATTSARIIAALGGASTVKTALFGGSNSTKFPIKLVVTKYDQTNKKIQNRNAGYIIVKAYNNNTGKHLQTKKMFIVKK